MKRYFTILLYCFLLAAGVAAAQGPPCNCSGLNALNTEIRDGRIGKAAALAQLKALLPQAASCYYAHGGGKYEKSAWVFPLAGYNKKVIGGKNGSGYIASGYDYFAGNKHGGHPAHDIFINDKDQDGNDDNTGRPVSVLSVSGGIVIATENSWDPQSAQRGGDYIWIYSPAERMLFYYAHNSKVLVVPGDVVKPGTAIASVGRTGANACKKRSPTHLHFMVLLLDDTGYPRPVDGYGVLMKLR